jgi:hypothetical protein
MAEHIDGTRLNTDLRYRFGYLAKFIDFTKDDIAAVNRLAPTVHPIIPVIVDTVYRKLFSFDITKHYFIIPNSDFDGKLLKEGDSLTLALEKMHHHNEMLGDFLKRIFLQREWDDSFLEYLSHVGKIHTNKAGTSSINVDYIHINALLGYLQNVLIDAILRVESIDDNAKRAGVLSLNKILWIHNELFTMHRLS